VVGHFCVSGWPKLGMMVLMAGGGKPASRKIFKIFENSGSLNWLGDFWPKELFSNLLLSNFN
jgi:hypothetical protein